MRYAGPFTASGHQAIAVRNHTLPLAQATHLVTHLERNELDWHHRLHPSLEGSVSHVRHDLANISALSYESTSTLRPVESTTATLPIWSPSHSSIEIQRPSMCSQQQHSGGRAPTNRHG